MTGQTAGTPKRLGTFERLDASSRLICHSFCRSFDAQRSPKSRRNSINPRISKVGAALTGFVSGTDHADYKQLRLFSAIKAVVTRLNCFVFFGQELGSHPLFKY